MGLKGTKTHENLKEAFAGESQANRRYLWFAQKADVEGYPDTAALFFASLDARASTITHLFLLGDIFEAWVGDDVMQQAFEAACVEVLEAASAGKQLAFMVGNRDFLVGSKLLKHCGMLALSSPTRLMAWDQPILLIHGDELCLADTDYLRFRAQVRQAAWQQAFLVHPLPARLAQARQMREASQAHQQAHHGAGAQAAHRHGGGHVQAVVEGQARGHMIRAEQAGQPE